MLGATLNFESLPLLLPARGTATPYNVLATGRPLLDVNVYALERPALLVLTKLNHHLSQQKRGGLFSVHGARLIFQACAFNLSIVARHGINRQFCGFESRLWSLAIFCDLAHVFLVHEHWPASDSVA